MNTEETQTPQDQPEQQAQPAPSEQPSQQAPSEQPAAPEPSGVVSKEVAEGKAFAVLSYALNFVALPFFLVPLIMRNNEFSLYHAKQCLMLWLLGVACSVVSGIMAITVILACVVPILWIAVVVFCLVLNIMGIMNASKGEQKPLPLIGKWGEEWFKGLKKV